MLETSGFTDGKCLQAFLFIFIFSLYNNHQHIHAYISILQKPLLYFSPISWPYVYGVVSTLKVLEMPELRPMD